MQPSRRLILGTAAILLTFGARAHTDKPHAKKGPVRKEQKDWGIAGEVKEAKRSIDVGMALHARPYRRAAGRDGPLRRQEHRQGDA
jgi:hypothetical protein